MKLPESVTRLLEELQEEHLRSNVETIKTSEAVIYLGADAEEAEDGIRLNAEACRLLFARPSTVERLLDALNREKASLALFDVGVSGSVLDALERGFVAVDEG